MSNRFEFVNDLVEEALDLPPAEREDFVSLGCGKDEELLAGALRLLALSDSADGFLESPPVAHGGIRAGDVLGGRFLILHELGAGGMGSILLAEDRQLGKVALKILHPELRQDARVMERFLAEIVIGRALRHPNVCPVFDLVTFEHGPGAPIAACTMQYLPGETLRDRLSRGPIPPDEAMHIARGIAAGIDALHAAGIIHRDLKPDNIMLTPGGDGEPVPVVMDFGLASYAGAGSAASIPYTPGAAISGSPDYMAPEQFRTAAITPAADIYAFGLILFEMIAGARPFPVEDLLPAVIRRTTEDAPRARSVAADVPQVWDSAIAHALARKPSDRPGSARELLYEMEERVAKGGRRCHHRLARSCSHARRARSSSLMRPV
jgi:serine/threonine-protein kinase